VDASQLFVSENVTTPETNTIVSSLPPGVSQPSSTVGSITPPKVHPTTLLTTGLDLFAETPTGLSTTTENATLIPPTAVHAGVDAKTTAAVKSSSGLFLLKKSFPLVCFVVAITCN